MGIVQITERDIKLLKVINGCGFVDMDYVSRYFKWRPKLVYRRLKQLVRQNYLQQQSVFHRKPGIYYVTQKGVQVSQDHLPALRKINLATYHHDLLVTKLSLQICQQYGGEFIGERELRHQLGVNVLNDKLHVPDGVLILKDHRIAIEVELTVKSASRLKKIMQHYQKDLNIHAVWYFCGNQQVKNKLDKSIKDTSFIKTHLLTCSV